MPSSTVISNSCAPFGPGRSSLIIRVPDGVPSVLHNSPPRFPSLAVNRSCPSYSAKAPVPAVVAAGKLLDGYRALFGAVAAPQPNAVAVVRSEENVLAEARELSWRRTL